jgi:hypothetical protein
MSQKVVIGPSLLMKENAICVMRACGKILDTSPYMVRQSNQEDTMTPTRYLWTQGLISPDPQGTLVSLADYEALRQQLESETAIVDRVWKALGVTTYKQANGKSIDELVTQLRQRAEELDKQCQGYYGEASEGWTKFREAERQVADLTAKCAWLEQYKIDADEVINSQTQSIADLTAKLAASERAAYDVEGTIEMLKTKLAALQLQASPKNLK